MYKPRQATKTKLNVNKGYIGESIEEKVERIRNNKEGITDGAPIIHTPRADGVRADTNIRTDRFELSTEAMGEIAKSYVARREEFMKSMDKQNKGPESGPAPEPGG